ncbi:DoxX family protein [Paraburkholderia sp. SIMBA_030]|uniref:DoxX family protein n=1 Tax=Paraburkholderia sp. SIMBA_030 TaxID=3085773 RepID=UPI00397D5C13
MSWLKTTHTGSARLLLLLYLASATLYVVKGDWVRQTLADLGYPSYLVPILIAVKILAVVAILSRISVALSDLAHVLSPVAVRFSAH